MQTVGWETGDSTQQNYSAEVALMDLEVIEMK